MKLNELMLVCAHVESRIRNPRLLFEIRRVFKLKQLVTIPLELEWDSSAHPPAHARGSHCLSADFHYGDENNHRARIEIEVSNTGLLIAGKWRFCLGYAAEVVAWGDLPTTLVKSPPQQEEVKPLLKAVA